MAPGWLTGDGGGGGLLFASNKHGPVGLPRDFSSCFPRLFSLHLGNPNNDNVDSDNGEVEAKKLLPLFLKNQSIKSAVE